MPHPIQFIKGIIFQLCNIYAGEFCIACNTPLACFIVGKFQFSQETQWWFDLVNFIIELQHEISNNVVCAPSKDSDQSAHTHSLIRAFASSLNILTVKLLT